MLQGGKIYKTYEFKNKTVKACDNCDVEIRSGEVVVLVGESGSGKTTLASILAGTLGADSGEINFQGQKLQGNSATRIKHGIQMVFQDPFSSTNELLSNRSGGYGAAGHYKRRHKR